MSRGARPRTTLAVHTATGCRACEHGILELDQGVAGLGRLADPVFWPYVLGTPWEALPLQVDVTFFAGAIRTEADREAARTLRERSRLLVAVGACAAFGGLPGLASLARDGAPAEPAAGEDAEAGAVAPLPALEPAARSLAQVAAVDYAVPGCPPTPSLLWTAALALLARGESTACASFAAGRLPERIADAIASGVLPPRGSTFAGERAVCGSCSRVKEEKRFGALRRPFEAYQESGRCLLEQGLVCQGVATQGGCGGLCTGAGVPCRGCFGKATAVFDPGAKMVAAIGSTFDSARAEEIAALVDGFLDLAGTFYRYTAPSQCALLAPPPGAAGGGREPCRS